MTLFCLLWTSPSAHKSPRPEIIRDSSILSACLRYVYPEQWMICRSASGSLTRRRSSPKGAFMRTMSPYCAWSLISASPALQQHISCRRFPRRKDSDSGPGISEMEILNSNLRTDHTKIAAKAINNSSTGIVASLARFGVIASRYLWRRKGGNLDQHTMMIDPGIYEA